MFPEIKDFVYATRAEATLHSKLIDKAFLNKDFLGVDEYYDLMGIEPIPEEAHMYYWPSPLYFAFAKDSAGYHIVAMDPIKLEEETNEQSDN